MAFNSFQFVYFFLLTYLIYLLLNHKAQNLLLLVASYIFYGSWDWRFLFLILASTLTDYCCGRGMEYFTDQRRRKLLLLTTLTFNLGVLCIFKYFDFFSVSLQALLNEIGLPISLWTLQVTLPVGISFYTFQSLSYSIDVYRGVLKPVRNFLDFALFVAFFPQLVAGPIERATHLLPQVLKPRSITNRMISDGAWLILLGYVKKLVIADNMAMIANAVFQDLPAYSLLGKLCGAFAFTLQIYGDFAGYSDIARGLAKLMGFDLMVNFQMPYFSRNPPDFWRRWHISLSTWLRDYLFLPVFYAANRRLSALPRAGKSAQVGAYVWATMVTMTLGGLWHGASWHFVVWGMYHGVLLSVHRLAQVYIPGFARRGRKSSRLRTVLKTLGFFQLICLGWIIFRVPSLSNLLTFFSTQQAMFNSEDLQTLGTILAFYLPLLGFQICKEYSGDLHIIQRAPLYLRVILYTLLIILIASYTIHEKIPFIYFQF